MEEKIKELIWKHIRNLESIRVLYGLRSDRAHYEETLIAELESLLKHKQVEDIKENVITVRKSYLRHNEEIEAHILNLKGYLNKDN